MTRGQLGAGVHVPLQIRRLGEIANRVCRVETADGRLGTGVLVGESLLLTNHHVVGHLKAKRGSSAGIRFRFDHRWDPASGTAQATTVFRPAEDWWICGSGFHRADVVAGMDEEPGLDHLDYALLRLAPDDPGTPPGRMAPPAWLVEAPERGWETPSDGDDGLMPGADLELAQHSGGEPLQVFRGKLTSARGTRLRYDVQTAPGSSGSPGFDRGYRFVLLHHAGDPAYEADGLAAYNQGIKTSAIRADLRRAGVDHLLSEWTGVAPIAPRAQPFLRSAATPQDQDALAAFLGQAFPTGELRRLLRFDDVLHVVVDDVRWQQGRKRVVHEVVEALEERGLIGRHLWDVLLREREHRGAEIKALSQRFDP